MKTVIHNKLIRDKIPEKIALHGDSYHISELTDDDEYKRYLKFKLFEELQEYCASGEVEELADILEVVYACANVHGVSNEKLDTIRYMKAEKYGKFNDRIFLVSTKSDEDTTIRNIEHAVNKYLESFNDDYADDKKSIMDTIISYYKNGDYQKIDMMLDFCNMMGEVNIKLNEYNKKIFDNINEQGKAWRNGLYVKPFPDDFDTLEGCPNFGTGGPIDPVWKHTSFFNPEYNDLVHNYMKMVDGSKSTK